MSNKNQERIYAFDVLRILSACAVMMIHISADFVKMLDRADGGFFLANVLNSLSRFAVPVFVMISGALMLDENKSIPAGKMWKSIWNMLCILFAWSFFYAISYDVIKPIIFHEEISVCAVLNTFFNGHYHMWYLYVLLGLYAITPLLRLLIKKENVTLVRHYLVFSVVVCFALPFVNHIFNHILPQKNVLGSFVENFQLHYFNEYLVYYITGWYIAHVGIQRKHRKFVYLVGIAGLGVTVVGAQTHFGTDMGNYYYENFSINVFAYGIAVFTWIYYLMQSKNSSLGERWVKLSNYTFGAYLIHCCYLFFFKKLTEGINDTSLRIILIFAPAVVLSFLTVAIMAKIPIVKKLVRG